MVWGKTLPKLSHFSVELGEITGEGDIAYVQGKYKLELGLPDGTNVTERGVFLNIFGRQRDGGWLYTHCIWHSTEPAPAVASSVAGSVA